MYQSIVKELDYQIERLVIYRDTLEHHEVLSVLIRLRKMTLEAGQKADDALEAKDHDLVEAQMAAADFAKRHCTCTTGEIYDSSTESFGV